MNKFETLVESILSDPDYLNEEYWGQGDEYLETISRVQSGYITPEVGVKKLKGYGTPERLLNTLTFYKFIGLINKGKMSIADAAKQLADEFDKGSKKEEKTYIRQLKTETGR